MNRAGTPSGKVAAARLRGMKKVDAMEEVDSPFVVEKKMTKPQKDKKEEIVDSMSAAEFEKRYPGRGKEVMYATATKLAQKCSENVQRGPILPGERGKKVYPKNDQPKKTGAKLPKINHEELSIDQQMKIARDAAKDRNPNPDHKAIRGNMLRKPLPKDTRTDAQQMTDATGPRDAFGRPAKSGYSGG